VVASGSFSAGATTKISGGFMAIAVSQGNSWGAN